MVTPGRVGVIADDTLQGHLLAGAIKSQGYQVLINTDPEHLQDHWLTPDAIDLWIVDLSREDRWQHFLDTLLERATAPLLFCDGQAPARTAERYPRWERRLVSKIVNYIGAPASETLATLPPTQSAVPIPEPREFLTLAQTKVAQRVWVLGASLGGPAAVKQFLDCLPEPLPVAFVLAQHIDQGFVDTLCQVLRQDSKLTCQIAAPGTRLTHGQVLVAPVTESMTFDSNGNVELTGEPWDSPYTPCIDQTLNHLKQGFGQCDGVIVFSGMGNDGAIVAPRLAREGTAVWAQSASSCAESSQPDSVRETGCVSYSGSPQQLARQLVEQVRCELIGVTSLDAPVARE